MKISVITMHNVKNYGSVLQCYATQTYFEKKGLEVEFIDYWRKNILPLGISIYGEQPLRFCIFQL